MLPSKKTISRIPYYLVPILFVVSLVMFAFLILRQCSAEPALTQRIQTEEHFARLRDSIDRARLQEFERQHKWLGNEMARLKQEQRGVSK